jgi:hypothetical protein
LYSVTLGREDWGKLVIVSHETQRMGIKSSYDVRIHLCIVKARADVKKIREIRFFWTKNKKNQDQLSISKSSDL